MAGIVVLAQVLNFLVRRHPEHIPDEDEVVAREIEKQRARGLNIPEPTKQVA